MKALCSGPNSHAFTPKTHFLIPAHWWLVSLYDFWGTKLFTARHLYSTWRFLSNKILAFLWTEFPTHSLPGAVLLYKHSLGNRCSSSMTIVGHLGDTALESLWVETGLVSNNEAVHGDLLAHWLAVTECLCTAFLVNDWCRHGRAGLWVLSSPLLAEMRFFSKWRKWTLPHPVKAGVL